MKSQERTSSAGTEYEAEAGSYRDRSGQVFYRDGSVYRGLSRESLDDWYAFSTAPCFSGLMSRGAVIHTEEVELDHQLLDTAGYSWAGYLRHDRIPMISYPYEWSFGMLKDAALLQLELLLTLIGDQLTMKDASSYNVQWIGSHPVFIDTPSIQRMEPGTPWVGYRQYCELFLNPLLLAAYKCVDFHPWLRGSVDGIPAESLAGLMSARDMFRGGVLKHVILQARMNQKHSAEQRDVKSELKNAGFNAEMIKVNLKNLINLVDSLQWSSNTRPAPSPARHEEDSAVFVNRMLHNRQTEVVWDLGARDGALSQVSGRSAQYVVAMDPDHANVERMYQRLKTSTERNILPMVHSLADPSPAIGWRLTERKPLTQRRLPDLTVAIGMTHHIVIGANVPMQEYIGWLASLECDLLIDFADRSNPEVRQLLANKDDNYVDYDLDWLERCLSTYFELGDRMEASDGTRTFYFAERHSGRHAQSGA